VSPRVPEDSVHPRLQLGASVRPLNFTVRGTYSGAVPKSNSALRRGRGSEDTPLPRRADAVGLLPTRSARPDRKSSRCCAAAEAVAFWVGRFGAHPSLDVGAARRRAVRPCQGTKVPSFEVNSSPSNNCLERSVMRLWGCAASAGRSMRSRRTGHASGRPLKRGR
jgi:hypothetical protein